MLCEDNSGGDKSKTVYQRFMLQRGKKFVSENVRRNTKYKKKVVITDERFRCIWRAMDKNERKKLPGGQDKNIKLYRKYSLNIHIYKRKNVNNSGVIQN